MKRSKHGLYDRFPAKENPYMEKALLDWQIVVHEFFLSERSLNQLKATGFCIRSMNKSNHSISVRLFELS